MGFGAGGGQKVHVAEQSNFVHQSSADSQASTGLRLQHALNPQLTSLFNDLTSCIFDLLYPVLSGTLG